MLAPLELPSIPHAEILTDTVVQVSVGPLGIPFSPVLLSSSGSPEADREALGLVKSVRFKPLGRGNSLHSLHGAKTSNPAIAGAAGSCPA